MKYLNTNLNQIIHHVDALEIYCSQDDGHQGGCAAFTCIVTNPQVRDRCTYSYYRHAVADVTEKAH